MTDLRRIPWGLLLVVIAALGILALVGRFRQRRAKERAQAARAG